MGTHLPYLFNIKEQSDEKNANEAIITIDCIIFENAIENDYPFTLEITIVGNFEVEGEIEHEDFMRFCELNGTAVLFPYLRGAITNITGSTNLIPLVLPLVNISNFDKKNRQ